MEDRKLGCFGIDEPPCPWCSIQAGHPPGERVWGMLFTGLLDLLPPYSSALCFSSDLHKFVCGHVSLVPLRTLASLEKGLCGDGFLSVCTLSGLLLAWTWIFSIKCDYQEESGAVFPLLYQDWNYDRKKKTFTGNHSLYLFQQKEWLDGITAV